MLRVIHLAIFASLPIFLAGSVRADVDAGGEVDEQREQQWRSEGWAMLNRFCIDCHNADYQEAEVDLSPFHSLAYAEENPELWTRVLQMVRFGAMPPEDAELPSDQQRRSMADAIDQAVYNVTCDLRPQAGRVTARRLNRVEYNNTIRDLFGMEIDATADFPSDEVGGGFDNNADVLAMPPMLFEKYIEAAEQVAEAVLLDPDSLQQEKIELVGERIAVVGESDTESFYGRLFAPDGFAWVEFELEHAGVYRIRLSGKAAHSELETQAIAIYDQDGRPLHTASYDYSDGSSSHTASFKHELPAGRGRLIIAPLDEEPDDLKDLPTFPDLDRLDEEALKAGREQFLRSLEINRKIKYEDYAFMVRKMNLEGPSDFPEEALPPSQSKIVRKVAGKRGNEYREVQRSAKVCLTPLIKRAFRGPVDDETIDRYTALVKAATDRGASYHRGLQEAITAMLVSPRFLFRVELPAEDAQPDEDGAYPLDDHQLATRLSYFLWSSMPDDELFDLAEQGKLRDPGTLQQQVQRMMADPKAESMAQQFAAQWLALRNLEGMPRDEDAFPEYSDELVDSMIQETLQLFMHVLRENRPVAEMLNADYTFLDRRLAEFYGLEDQRRAAAEQAGDDDFVRVPLTAGPRRGILTHASVLTLTSYPTRTSPVLRGKWIMESVLGLEPPDPPAGVPTLEENEQVDQQLSVREQLALHRADPSCASCHRVMDQLGFGFEDFDAIGRFRGGADFDASGELPGGRVFNGGRQLAETLGATEAASFAHAVSEKLLGFALGRELSPADRCITEQIADQCVAGDFRLADLVQQVVASRPFQYFQAEEGANHDSK